VVGVAAPLILPSGAVRGAVAALGGRDAASRRRAGELTSRAAAGAGGGPGGQRA